MAQQAGNNLNVITRFILNWRVKLLKIRLNDVSDLYQSQMKRLEGTKKTIIASFVGSGGVVSSVVTAAAYITHDFGAFEVALLAIVSGVIFASIAYFQADLEQRRGARAVVSIYSNS